MKRIISICLAMLCITTLSLGFAACNGEQADSEPESVLRDAALDSQSLR